MVDLSNFADLTKAQDDGIDVDILHPGTGEPLDMTIRVAGPDSARQRNARTRISNERLRTAGNKKLTIVDYEAMSLKVAVASIITWSGIIENGQTIEFSADAATDLLTRYPFILEQVNTAIGDRAGFIKT